MAGKNLFESYFSIENYAHVYPLLANVLKYPYSKLVTAIGLPFHTQGQFQFPDSVS